MHMELCEQAEPTLKLWCGHTPVIWCSIHTTKFLNVEVEMDNETGPFAQMFKFDSPAAIWRFWNWLPITLLWPILVTMALLDIGFSWITLSVMVICGTVICVAYYILRNVLVSKGAAKSDLDAISKGIGLSVAATAAVGGGITFVTMLSVMLFANAIGVYETFVNETNLVLQFVIANVIVASAAFIGWRLKGRYVHEKYVPNPIGTESQ